MNSSHKYGDHACEYQHDKFLRGRTDLLEQIFRQSSSNRNTGSDGAGATPDSIKIDSNLEALEEGQKLTFYQIKDLERRVDFCERELGSCRFTMESQSRIIIQLVNSMPRMPREFMEDPELSAIASELNVQRDPAYHPYSYRPINYSQPHPGGRQSPLTTLGHHSKNISSTPSANSSGNRIPWDQNGNSSNGSNGTTYLNDIAGKSGFTATNGPIQDHMPFPNRQESQPFNNQSVGSDRSIRHGAARPHSLHTLNILILVCHNREQRLLSDILMQLHCLSFKFAVDMSHVLQCLEISGDFHVLFLDEVFESNCLLLRLRKSNPSLLIVFLSEQQEPSPPLEDPITHTPITHTLLKPPTAENLQEVLVQYLNRR